MTKEETSSRYLKRYRNRLRKMEQTRSLIPDFSIGGFLASIVGSVIVYLWVRSYSPPFFFANGFFAAYLGGLISYFCYIAFRKHMLFDKLLTSPEIDDELERDRICQEARKWDGHEIFAGLFITAIGSAWMGVFFA